MVRLETVMSSAALNFVSCMTYKEQGADNEIIDDPSCLNTLTWVKLGSCHQLKCDNRGTCDIGENENQTDCDPGFCIVCRPPDEAGRAPASCRESERDYPREGGQEQDTKDSN